MAEERQGRILSIQLVNKKEYNIQYSWDDEVNREKKEAKTYIARGIPQREIAAYESKTGNMLEFDFPIIQGRVSEDSRLVDILDLNGELIFKAPFR